MFQKMHIALLLTLSLLASIAHSRATYIVNPENGKLHAIDKYGELKAGVGINFNGTYLLGETSY